MADLHILLDTDASKKYDITGIGIYSPNNILIVQRLPDCFSLCSAEMTAILEATREIKKRNFKNSAIISDSKSALKISKWAISARNGYIPLSDRSNLQ